MLEVGFDVMFDFMGFRVVIQNFVDRDWSCFGIQGSRMSSCQMGFNVGRDLVIFSIFCFLTIYPPIIALQIPQSTVSTASIFSPISPIMASTSQYASNKVSLYSLTLLSSITRLFRIPLYILYFWSQIVYSSCLKYLLVYSTRFPYSVQDFIKYYCRRDSFWERSEWRCQRELVKLVISVRRLKGMQCCLLVEACELRLDIDPFLCIATGTTFSFMTLKPWLASIMEHFQQQKASLLEPLAVS